MAYLSDLIAVAPRFARSANLERDTGQLDPLDGYIVTAQALDVVDRIAIYNIWSRRGSTSGRPPPLGGLPDRVRRPNQVEDHRAEQPYHP